MTFIAEFTTPRETFAIGRGLANTDGLTGLTLELERVIPTGETLVPYFWVWGDGLERYEDNLEAEPRIEKVETIVRTDDGALYRIDWHNEMSTVIEEFFELDFTLLGGVCTVDGWKFEIRYPSSDDAKEFQRYITECGIPYTLERVRCLNDGSIGKRQQVTPEQREALLVAYRCGYFYEPRKAKLSELANRLDLSESSVAGRLRRGYASLIEEHLLHAGSG